MLLGSISLNILIIENAEAIQDYYNSLKYLTVFIFDVIGDYALYRNSVFYTSSKKFITLKTRELLSAKQPTKPLLHKN